MKKLILALILFSSFFASTGCVKIIDLIINSESKVVTAPADYGDFNEAIEIPSYLPADISDYTVKDYHYAIEKNTGLCYEIYLDITVSESQFESILGAVNSDARSKNLNRAFHSPDFYEIIFKDEYETSNDYYYMVGSADIEKVIYNEAECRIIFVLIHVQEDEIYYFEDIAYFKKLEITEEKYLQRKNNGI